jgi:hypothetical protein
MSGVDFSVTGVKAGRGGVDPVVDGNIGPNPPVPQPPRADQLALQGGAASPVAPEVLFSPGPVDPSRGFGLSVRGVGFFQLDTPQGLRLTRGGGFHVDAGGHLVNPQGLPVTPPVQVPADAQSILVTNDGRVLALLGDGSVVLAGVIQLASVPDPGGLASEGGALFAPAPASGALQLGAPGWIQFSALGGSSTGPGQESLDPVAGRTPVRGNLPALNRTPEPSPGALVDILG